MHSDETDGFKQKYQQLYWKFAQDLVTALLLMLKIVHNFILQKNLSVSDSFDENAVKRKYFDSLPQWKSLILLKLNILSRNGNRTN